MNKLNYSERLRIKCCQGKGLSVAKFCVGRRDDDGTVPVAGENDDNGNVPVAGKLETMRKGAGL